MRAIDADALQKEYMHEHDGKRLMLIDVAPTIEPQRKKGKWIDTTQGDHYKCSCCGTRAAFWFNEENSSGWEKDMSEWLSDFCPNCGADMTEGEE